MNMFFWMAILSVILAAIFGLIYLMADDKNGEWIMVAGMFLVAATLLSIAGVIIVEHDRKQRCRTDGGIVVHFKTGRLSCTNIPIGDTGVFMSSCSEDMDWRCDHLPAERPAR